MPAGHGLALGFLFQEGLDVPSLIGPGLIEGLADEGDQKKGQTRKEDIRENLLLLIPKNIGQQEGKEQVHEPGDTAIKELQKKNSIRRPAKKSGQPLVSRCVIPHTWYFPIISATDLPLANQSTRRSKRRISCIRGSSIVSI